MDIPERPFFMSNPDWYNVDDEQGIYVLTDKAPPKAVKSYEEFYSLLNSGGIL